MKLNLLFLLIIILFFLWFYYGINILLSDIDEDRPKLRKINNNLNYNVSYSFNYIPNTSRNNIKTCVFGLVAKNRWRTVRPFFQSLRNTGYKGDIIAFIYSKNFTVYEEYLADYDIQAIIFEKEYPYYSSINTHYPIPENILKTMPVLTNEPFFWHIIRHYLLNIWLQVYKYKYDYIFMGDVRDIVYQHNPFSWNFEYGVYLSHETQHCTYIESKFCSIANYNWIMTFNFPQYLMNNTFINSGVIFGSTIELSEFYKEYVEFMSTRAYNTTCDQGVLNYWILTKETPFHYPVYIFKGGYGYARTIGLDSQMYLNLYEPDSNLLFRNDDETIPLVIHQYDYGLKIGNDDRIIKYKQFFDDVMNNSRRVIMNTLSDYIVIRKPLTK